MSRTPENFKASQTPGRCLALAAHAGPPAAVAQRGGAATEGARTACPRGRSPGRSTRGQAVRAPQTRRRPQLCAVLLLGLLLHLLAPNLIAQPLPTTLGDLDTNNVVDVRDLVRLVAHLNRSNTLAASLAYFADMNLDGYLNESDVALMASTILGQTPVREFPPPTHRFALSVWANNPALAGA